ncbi:nucleotidyltransferase family protein [Phormidesmis sp. 146-35]
MPEPPSRMQRSQYDDGIIRQNGKLLMNIGAQLHEKREVILVTASKYGAYNVRVFGSVARGEADADSDVDFLVEMEAERSLLDLGGLLMEL